MEEFHGFEVVKPGETMRHQHRGVWAMFGICRADNPGRKYTCLNVGKSVNIGKELEVDFQRLERFSVSRKKVYRNQFNEKMFDYTEGASRQDWLYKEISEKYEAIIVIIVSNADIFEVEKYFAYSTKSRYWVSNGRYSPKRNRLSDDEIAKIRDGIDVSKIKDPDHLHLNLIEKINDFKTWYDAQ